MRTTTSIFVPMRITVTAGIALAILAAPLRGRAAEIGYSGALQFATGEYIFTDRTNSFYLLNGFYVSEGRVRVSVTLPVIYQNTSLVSNGGPGMISSGGEMGDGAGGHMQGGQMQSAGMNDFHEIGVGDPLGRADLEILKRGHRYLSMSIAALVKPPVAAAARSFGTGEWDFGAGLSAARGISRYFLSASMIYWKMGDPPGVDFKNPMAYSVAVGRPFAGNRFSAILSFSGYTQILEDTDPFRQLGISLAYWPTARRYLSGMVASGLSDSTPDTSISLGWGMIF
ncbi:MAG: hypothetical protein HY770_01340 [Chitinivibrionia bacterium]|nr:hypothetical protein [Chitinivibrionia bacterium]